MRSAVIRNPINMHTEDRMGENHRISPTHQARQNKKDVILTEFF